MQTYPDSMLPGLNSANMNQSEASIPTTHYGHQVPKRFKYDQYEYKKNYAENVKSELMSPSGSQASDSEYAEPAYASSKQSCTRSIMNKRSHLNRFYEEPAAGAHPPYDQYNQFDHNQILHRLYTYNNQAMHDDEYEDEAKSSKFRKIKMSTKMDDEAKNEEDNEPYHRTVPPNLTTETYHRTQK